MQKATMHNLHKRLNLLPQVILEKYEYDRFIKVTAICMAVIFLSLILIVMCLGVLNRRLEAQYVQYRELLSDERFTDSDEAARTLAGLRNGGLNAYDMEKGVPDVIGELTGAVTDGVYARSISYSSEDGIYIFKGIAERREDIMSFEKRVGQTGRFTDVSVTGLNGDGGRFISFTLTCQPKGEE